MTDEQPIVFKFGEFEVREREFLLIKAGEGVTVEPKAFRVLLFLLRASKRLIRKDEILDAVWEDTSVSDNSLTRSIATLRRLLGDNVRNPRYIATVPTVGYRFLCPVDISKDGSGIDTAPDPHIADITPGDGELRRREDSARFNFLDSIAVLPFENAGNEPDMEYLSDGIATSIINNLSQVQSLRVVPRTTVFRYKGTAMDAAQVGRELRVRVVLTGRVSQRQNVLHINAELIDTKHESQLFGASYKGDLDDIFAIQDEIAAQVTNKLSLPLNDQDKQRLTRRPTKSREAYYLLLKSLYWANKWTPDGTRKGIDYARQAIDVDPVYAEAWTALAYLFVLVGFFGGSPSTEIFARAKAAAVKALAIDECQPDAHATLAYVQLVYDWDWRGARQELLRAIELGPNLANGHWVYSHWYLTQALYPEAMTEAILAMDIDPLSVQFNYQVGAIHFFARHYDQAIEQLHATIELDPLFAHAHQLLAAAYARKGMRQDAMDEIEKGSELAKNDPRSKALWGVVSAMTGNLVEARKFLEQLRQETRPPNFLFAYQCSALHALLGERDDAFACLDMARQGHTVQLAYVAVAQELETLHDDPRFRQLLLTIGVPTSKSEWTGEGSKTNEGVKALPR